MFCAATSTRSARRLRECLALCALMATAWAVSAGTLSFLDGSPISFFNKDDHDLMKKNAYAVLDSPEPEATHDWMNPATGNSGTATVRGEFTNTDGATCKRLLVSNFAKQGSVKGASTYVVCKYEGRGWLLHPDAVPAPSSPK
jgi:hypothetical protein